MYSSQQITNKSYKDIQRLYKLSFDIDDSIAFVKRKYDTAGFGLKNIGLIAKSDTDELAAYYGVFPVVLNFSGKDYLVAQSGDTMTAPNHRKKGLFTRLAKETYILSKSNGIKLVFGFPNQFSFPGFKHKLNWEFHGCMQRFTFKVNTIPLCELSSKFTKLIPLYNSYVKNRIAKYEIDFDQIDYDAFNFSLANGIIKKDRNFFTYKLNRGNAYVVSINGIQLLLKANAHLIIGEVGKIEDDQAELLMQSVRKLARRLGCRKIIFTLSKNHWLYKMLTRIQLPIESLPIGFYPMSEAIDVSEIQFSNADYDTF